jgi:hypothetical protein
VPVRALRRHTAACTFPQVGPVAWSAGPEKSPVRLHTFACRRDSRAEHLAHAIRILCMNRALAGTVFLFAASAVAQSPCKPSVTGDLQIHSFQSIAYGESQTLRVWLPPGYNDPANSQKKYSALYLLDGQNAFDSCTSFDGKNEWQVDESLTRLIAENRVEHIIVVGVDSGPRRIHQYSPY